MSSRANRMLILMIASVLVVLTLVGPFQRVVASASAQRSQPVLPARIFGGVQVDGQNIPAGAQVTAAINRVVYATTTTTITNGISVYVIDVPGDDLSTGGIVEGGREGDTITFAIADVQANQTAVWSAGAVIELNLTMTEPTVTPIPITPTVTPVTPASHAPVSVPEPVTLILFGAGLASLSAVGVRRIHRRRH